MKSMLRSFSCGLGLVSAMAFAPALRPSVAQTAGAQRLAIPSYFYPGATWTQLIAGAPTVGIAIINPNSGPGRKSDANYVATTNQTKAAGVKVLGYVYTSYGARAIKNVKSDISKYFSWYSVDGIFLDEVSTSCTKSSYYTQLNSYVKSLKAGAITVINPGTQTNECYMSTADIVLNFEDTYSSYTASYSAPAWVANYPASRFWHLVHNTATEAEMLNAIALSKQRNAGWVYVTPDVLPNPWDTLPAGTYWTNELSAAAAP